MEKYLLEMFTVSLLVTLLLELPIAWCFGLRHKREVLLVVLVNVLTNPAAVLLHFLGVPQIPIEIAVIITEAAIYRCFSNDAHWKIQHPILLAISANLFSWLMGLVMQL